MKNFQNLTAAEAVEQLKKVGLEDDANLILESNHQKDLNTIKWPWNTLKAYEHTSYAYGFIAESISGVNNLIISDARNINSDDNLKNQRITVSLDFLRIFDYPGNGIHNVLFKFNGKNQFVDKDEDVAFNQTFSIQEGERAPVSGYPIFIGLNTGSELVQFNVEIVNVSNDNDEKVMSTINSSVFTDGLKLVGTINPAISIVTEYAKGITEMIASRNRNEKIHSPKMGLYFGNTPTRMKLAKGVYIAIQMSNPDKFDWSKWIYNRSFGTIQTVDGSQTELPFNYFVFSISKTN